MKLFKKVKKGFTLVELVVVIAIIAILAGVSIAVYVGVTNKAKLSNDQTMISQMNTTLAAYKALNDFEYAGDSIIALNENGFSGKYTPYSSGYHYAYHFASNTMYLLDKSDKAVFPKSDVSLSDLWVLWQNTATDKINGADKYISLVNINNNGYYATHFGSGNYTIDLARHYVAYTASTLTNVKVVNGILVSGAAKEEGKGVTELGKVTKSDITSGTAEKPSLIENKVYDCSSSTAMSGMSDVTFKNCYLYNCNDAGTALSNRTFENCTFIDSTKYIFNLQGTFDFEGTLLVKNCTFINCKRIFNVPVGVHGQVTSGTITVTGNTFYGVTEQNRSTCQFQKQCNSLIPGTDKGDTSKALKYLDITFSDNYYVECATNQAGLFTLYDSLQTGAITADHITFTNNKVGSKIDPSKYIVNDDGKLDSAVASYDATFKTSLTQKFTASLAK